MTRRGCRCESPVRPPVLGQGSRSLSTAPTGLAAQAALMRTLLEAHAPRTPTGVEGFTSVDYLAPIEGDPPLQDRLFDVRRGELGEPTGLMDWERIQIQASLEVRIRHDRRVASASLERRMMEDEEDAIALFSASGARADSIDFVAWLGSSVDRTSDGSDFPLTILHFSVTLRVTAHG